MRETPLIILGLPRSGTKLLRQLLNQHSSISIPEIESYLIPYSINKFGFDYDLCKKEKRSKFFTFFQETLFYNSFDRLGKKMDYSEFENLLDDYNWQAVFKLIYSFYGPKKMNDVVIWGDKSPGSFHQIKYINNIYPNTKFIHILRDPRDYCVSVNKAWKKNIYRAAEEWQEEVSYFFEIQRRDDIQAKIIKYEALITQPDRVLEEICDFFDIKYESKMSVLSTEVENLGSAKGSTEIVVNNKNKYFKSLSENQIRKIEEITFEAIKDADYTINFASFSKRISFYQKWLFKFSDGLNSLLFHVKNKGFKEGMVYAYKFHKNKYY